MPRFATLAVLSIVAGLTVGASVHGAEQTPQAFLEKLYGNCIGPNRSGLATDSHKVLARYFTPDVVTLFDKMYAVSKKNEEPPTLDGDPFFEAQEWDIGKIDISVDPPAGDKATGHVGFTNFKEVRSFVVDMVKLAPGWRIYDIHWGDDGSLRQVLTEPAD